MGRTPKPKAGLVNWGEHRWVFSNRNRDAGRVADEIVSHLGGLVGSRVEVTLEINAEVQDGVPDKVVHTVTENSRTLKFTDHGFEES